MSEIKDFIDAPSQELLDSFTKEQLLIVAEHFSVVVVRDKRLKENIKVAKKKKKLVEEGLMPGDKNECPSPAASQFQSQGLTFEQQKEILILQMEHEKMKQELEIKKQLELERIRQESERAKLDLERQRLALVRDGMLSENQGRQVASSPAPRFDVNNLCLLPQFNDRCRLRSYAAVCPLREGAKGLFVLESWG